MAASPPDTQWDKKVKEALLRYWGYSTLRPLQEEVIKSSLDGRDAVVVMPTGGGKSLCFQLPAVATKTLTVVVSPLIALMKDQVDGLKLLGVEAAALNSSLEMAEEREVEEALARGQLRLVYVSPERLLLPGTLRMLAEAGHGQGPSRFAIDEAHCISSWGHDFRPEYHQLSRIKEVFPGIPVQAFTATATPQVQRDIAIQLKLERPRKFVGVFDRPNLTYRIVAKDDPIRRMVEAVHRCPGEGVIIYCLSRRDTEDIAESLVAKGVEAKAYHAGLPSGERAKISEDFAAERLNVVVATVAFGMGIDRSNVRCVIHECLPKSMEGYQQETGRAGRDGLPSECVLLYHHGDVNRLKSLLSQGEPSFKDHNMRLLDEVKRYAVSSQCRHKTLSEHFGQPYEVPAGGCGACDVCLGGMAAVEGSTEIGRTILQALKEHLEATRRKCGASYLAALLRGHRREPILERGGDKLPSFGALKAHPAGRITLWIHQLTDLGLLDVEEGQYPLLGFTSAGLKLLEDGGEVVLKENVALERAGSSSKAKKDKASLTEFDPEAFEVLRGWRKAKAEERKVPPYIIFPDSALAALAGLIPGTEEDLLRVPGVGERKAEDFGKELLALLAHFAPKSPTAQPPAPRRPKPAPKSKPSPKTAPAKKGREEFFALFDQKSSPQAAALRLGATESEGWSWLSAYLEEVEGARVEDWVDGRTLSQAREALVEAGLDRITQAHAKLEGKVHLNILNLVRSSLLAERKRQEG